MKIINKNITAYILSFYCATYAYSQDDSFCKDKVADFGYELKQSFSTNKFVKGWGPKRKVLNLNPDFLKCLKDSDWKRRRILAAVDYWIKQKLNYCHHYLPNYATPVNESPIEKNKGGYCSQAKNLNPDSGSYQQTIRWNYSGKDSETLAEWVNKKMWYGMDCSNYTTFLYNFALGTLFSSNIEYQAGKRPDHTQNNLSPNQQSGTNILDNPQAAGLLVCKDNTTEVNHSCAGHGGYLSVFDETGKKHPGSILASDLAVLALHPGDLLFIATPRADAMNPSKVVHVVMWLGKQVGYGVNDIPPSQIAPNGFCSPNIWKPKIGDWIITDSHYQGADYRILTPCYYLNNLWGVRRVD